MASPLVLMSLTQGAAKMLNDASYHAQRARTERELAYRAPDERVGDAHLRLSALHLSRAMVLEELIAGWARLNPAGDAVIAPRCW
jgi:hypothetical protein